MVYWSTAQDPTTWGVPEEYSCEWPLRRNRIVIYADKHIEAVNWRKAKRIVRNGTAKIVVLNLNPR